MFTSELFDLDSGLFEPEKENTESVYCIWCAGCEGCEGCKGCGGTAKGQANYLCI